MKKIALLLLLGVSPVSFAAVTPSDVSGVRTTSVIRPNVTKMKMMVKAKTLPNSAGADFVSDLQRYNNVVTMDNVNAVENMSRLMQDDPERLMQQITGGKSEHVNFDIDRRKMGSEEIVDDYVSSPVTEDPSVKLAGLNTPELLGSFEEVRASKDELVAMHQNALMQVEEIGHQHLGQKSAPIQMPMTVEEIKKSGIDTRRLPRGWEDALKKAEANRKLYQEQEARKKKNAAGNAEAKKQQEDQGANQQKTTMPIQEKVRSTRSGQRTR